MNERTRLYLDMDGTLAEFIPASTLEELFEENYFRGLHPHQALLDAVRGLINKDICDVYILSSYLTDSKYALKEKVDWVDRHLPEIPRCNRVFVPCGKNKSHYIPGGVRGNDCLLDDYSVNLKEWELAGGKAIKFMNGINGTKGTFLGDKVYNGNSNDLERSLIKIIRENEKKVFAKDTQERGEKE